MSGPLAGVRVVELTGIGPGPFAAMLLAELGADVVRFQRPGAVGEAMAPEDDLLLSGRPVLELDLRTDEGITQALDQVDSAEILLESFRPGVAERLGIGPAACHARNPALVYGRMTGWGQTGPYARAAGHDLNYIAVTGVLHAIGRAGGPPQVPLNLLGDFAGGALYLVVGTLAALTEARQSGRGRVVDAAIIDGTTHLATVLHRMRNVGRWSDERGTNLLDTGAPFYDVYETADGRYVAVAAIEAKFWDVLVATLGVDLVDRTEPRNWPRLREQLASVFRQRTRDAWTTLFADTDACVSPVLDLDEAARDPQMTFREVFQPVPGGWRPAPAPRFLPLEP